MCFEAMPQSPHALAMLTHGAFCLSYAAALGLPFLVFRDRAPQPFGCFGGLKWTRTTGEITYALTLVRATASGRHLS